MVLKILENHSGIVEVGRRLQNARFIVGTEGNISMRLPNGRILITPSGHCKGELEESELMEVSLNGKIISGNGRPSTEYLLHLYVYQQRKDISACVHSHPPHCLAMAITGNEFPEVVMPEVAQVVGKIPLTKYAVSGTNDVPRSLESFIKNHKAFLLRNHGLVTIGATLKEAYFIHETVERYAEILSLSARLKKQPSPAKIQKKNVGKSARVRP